MSQRIGERGLRELLSSALRLRFFPGWETGQAALVLPNQAARLQGPALPRFSPFKYRRSNHARRTRGSKIFGLVSEQTTYPQSYVLLSILVVGMIAVLFFHRHKHREAAADRGRARRICTIASGGGEGGMFFSGAMRCPKCRSDMLQLDVDGTVIDRCDRCHGIWFDAGEMEALRGKDIAKAVASE